MLFIHGHRTVCIKRETDNYQVCSACKSIGLDVTVYRKYFHIFFIPIAPSGPKSAKLHCSRCREPRWFQGAEKMYEQATRTPVYFYSGLLIVAGLIIMLAIVNITTQNKKAAFVANPMVGDVYTIRTDKNNKTFYYFMRISEIKGDTVYVYHNNMEYQTFTSGLHDDDYFVAEEELSFNKKTLKDLLDKGVINAVTRSYGAEEGFNRIK